VASAVELGTRPNRRASWRFGSATLIVLCVLVPLLAACGHSDPGPEGVSYCQIRRPRVKLGDGPHSASSARSRTIPVKRPVRTSVPPS